MKYSPNDIFQGTTVQQKAAETPTTFATQEGQSQVLPSKGFGKSRMAGEVGARAVQLMSDPMEQQRTTDWMNRFGLSNEGFQFNQARMMMANPQPQQQEQA
jgi:hypothetical protein